MKRRYEYGLLAALSVAAIAEAFAQSAAPAAGSPPAQAVRSPALDTALAMAQTALAVCQSKGAAISVSVVDAAGQAKVTLAADGSPGKTSTAVRKAATAVAFKASGSQMEAREKTDKEFAAKIAANPNDYNDHAGSLPLKVGSEIIGGIGISGAATHELDEECAKAAVDKLQAKLK